MRRRMAPGRFSGGGYRGHVSSESTSTMHPAAHLAGEGTHGLIQGLGDDPKRLKVAVYKYAEDPNSDRTPRDLVLLHHIDRFGVQAVMGRNYLGAGEIRRMIYCENLVRFHRSKTKAESWAEWAAKFPGPDAILNEAMILAERHGN